MFLLIACGSHTRIHDTPRYKEKKHIHTHTKIQFERERNIEKLESKYSIYFLFFFKPNIFSLNQHFSTSGFTLHKLFHLQQ